MKKDEPIDRLLERASRVDAQTAGACLDAETLAAWTDGTLTGAARVSAETHAADCLRCLQVLSAIARTTPPASEATTTSWFSVRLLVPVATALVAITTWVVVQNPSAPPPVTAPAATETKQVEVQSPSAPADSPARDSVASARTESLAKRKVERPAAGTALGRGTANEAATQLARPTAPAAAAAPPPAAAASRSERLAVLDGTRVFTTVASPDPNVRWRFSGVTVERSTDGGTTWRGERFLPVLELLAGSSPDPRICWLVGRAGEVWLTTDGASWRRLEFPDMTANLAAVSARDANSASVTTSAGTTYRTQDGGKTWSVQESGAAPF